MQRSRLRVLVLLSALAFSAPASAAVRIGLGADYWVTGRGLFDLNFAVDAPVLKHFSVGGRFGGLLLAPGPAFGVPLDVTARFNFDRVYLEGLVGPWILFEDAPIRLHAGIGFGLNAGSFTVGLELGWLDPAATAGLRVAWRI